MPPRSPVLLPLSVPSLKSPLLSSHAPPLSPLSVPSKPLLSPQHFPHKQPLSPHQSPTLPPRRTEPHLHRMEPHLHRTVISFPVKCPTSPRRLDPLPAEDKPRPPPLKETALPRMPSSPPHKEPLSPRRPLPPSAHIIPAGKEEEETNEEIEDIVEAVEVPVKAGHEQIRNEEIRKWRGDNKMAAGEGVGQLRTHGILPDIGKHRNREVGALPFSTPSRPAEESPRQTLRTDASLQQTRPTDTPPLCTPPPPATDLSPPP